MTPEELELCYNCNGYKPCHLEMPLYVSLEENDAGEEVGYCVWKETIDNDIAKYKKDPDACLTFSVEPLVDNKPNDIKSDSIDNLIV